MRRPLSTAGSASQLAGYAVRLPLVNVAYGADLKLRQNETRDGSIPSRPLERQHGVGGIAGPGVTATLEPLVFEVAKAVVSGPARAIQCRLLTSVQPRYATMPGLTTKSARSCLQGCPYAPQRRRAAPVSGL